MDVPKRTPKRHDTCNEHNNQQNKKSKGEFPEKKKNKGEREPRQRSGQQTKKKGVKEDNGNFTYL